jgi:hypothetical protein
METLTLLATLLPMSVSSGINLYATILMAGLSIQFKWVEGVPSGLDVLGSWPIIIVAGFFFILEALADKIPLIDHVWDMIHTVVRPLGACFIGFAVLGQADPVIMVIAALFAGSVALASHGGKAGARIAMNVMSPAENISNIAVSTAEDFGAGILTFIALKYPFEATAIAIVILMLMALIVPSLLRWAWYFAKASFVWVKSLGQKLLNTQVQPDNLPSDHVVLLHPKKPLLASACKAQNVKSANGRSGYLALFVDELTFTYNTWFGSKLWRLSLKKMISISLRKGWLMDVLEVHYLDDKNKKQKSNFAFLKDRTVLAEKIISKLKPASP